MQDIAIFISNHMPLAYGIAVVFVLLMIIEVLRLKRNNFNINTAKAVHLINRENAVIIDTRPLDTYRKGHIIDAVSLPNREIIENAKKAEKYRKKPIILVCNTGVESQKIAASLLKQGYNAYALAGGLRAWSEAQLPLVKD